MAWLNQARPGGNFYLVSQCGGQRTHRNLKTSDRATAERELARVRAEERELSKPSGQIRWRKEDWQQFSGLRGQSRVSKQSYALATRALQILSADSQRFSFLLSPVRTVTLADLGRISDAEIMRLAADEICDRQLTAKGAILFLRSLRGVHRAAQPSTLADALRQAIACHCALHPEVSKEQIAVTLHAIGFDYES